MSGTTVGLAARAFDSGRVRSAVDERLAAFLDAKARLAVAQGFPTEVTDVLRDLVLGGGKRIRPVLCVAGWCAAGRDGDADGVLQVAASLEMFHAFTLVHDDVMDRSATRRGRPSADLEAALRIARFKSAKYTVERPLQLGAVLAGADGGVWAALSAFGLPLGEAFQLRDDLLGAFGDSPETRKPEAEDLREGKHTALLALALRRATGADRDLLTGLWQEMRLGPGQVARIRAVLEGTGARSGVEELIEERRCQALQALQALEDPGLPPAAGAVLRSVVSSLIGPAR
ncbi:polyprenyl synthetase family protein [Streptomyces sp. KS 21]|uniref:polyprenyl synthetase family protein n=1 Tax=Streptomyces sp. KS 21 TaxID=2485150 RepID=UPI00106402FC|nr:polyprenyl synthetase family protein [Streptomyces sp. KS 21]TDU73653.1 polyprenyl synthetase [Streptomyces sp. KS 21]